MNSDACRPIYRWKALNLYFPATQRRFAPSIICSLDSVGELELFGGMKIRLIRTWREGEQERGNRRAETAQLSKHVGASSPNRGKRSHPGPRGCTSPPTPSSSASYTLSQDVPTTSQLPRTPPPPPSPPSPPPLPRTCARDTWPERGQFASADPPTHTLLETSARQLHDGAAIARHRLRLFPRLPAGGRQVRINRRFFPGANQPSRLPNANANVLRVQ